MCRKGFFDMPGVKIKLDAAGILAKAWTGTVDT
jgi:hypothetical protein